MKILGVEKNPITGKEKKIPLELDWKEIEGKLWVRLVGGPTGREVLCVDQRLRSSLERGVAWTAHRPSSLSRNYLIIPNRELQRIVKEIDQSRSRPASA